VPGVGLALSSGLGYTAGRSQKEDRPMPLRRLFLALVSVLPLAGCVTFYAKTEIVGGNERTAVSFQNDEVAQQFHAAIKKMNDQAGGEWVGVPFVTIYARQERMSDAAVWNEAVHRCDTNADGLITADEVAAFAKSLEN
jgi:hypothetical protein